MNLTFLEAANGLRLSKRHSPDGFTPYPHVKKVTSHHHTISTDKNGLIELERLIREHGELGHCLLKGDLKSPLVEESRAGKADRHAYTNLLVLDVDGIELPTPAQPKATQALSITAKDVITMSYQVLSEFPKAFQEVSYIAQASSSFGLKGNKVSLHIFILLEVAVPTKALKLWLQKSNFDSPLFTKQTDLSSNGMSLKFPIDVSVADNSKLIFIAPPSFSNSNDDPFDNPEDRLVAVHVEEMGTSTLDIVPYLTNASPELIHQKTVDLKNERSLRS